MLDNAIYFYSFATKQVKARKRFVLGHDVDMTAFDFNNNKNWAGESRTAAIYLEYLKKCPTLSETGVEWIERTNVAIIIKLCKTKN